MDRNIEYQPFIRRILLWFLLSYIVVITLDCTSFQNGFIKTWIYISVYHVVLATFVLFYFWILQMKMSVSFISSVMSPYVKVDFVVIVLSLLILSHSLVFHGSRSSLTWLVKLFSLFIFHCLQMESGKRLLLPNTPPNLWQSVKNLISSTFIELLYSLLRGVCYLLLVLVCFDYSANLLTKLQLFFGIVVEMVTLLAYLMFLYGSLCVVMLYPLDIAKLSHSVASSSLPSLKGSISFLLSVMNSTSVTSSTEVASLQSTLKNDTSVSLPKWEILTNFQSNYFQKFHSKCQPCSSGYPIIGYFKDFGGRNLLQMLSMQYLNKVNRINLRWRESVFSDELTFTEVILKSCSFIDAFTAQV